MIPLSPPTSHSICIQHATTWLLHDGGVFWLFCRQESASQSSETELSNAEIVLAAHRDLLPKGSVKHDAMSKSLLKEGMLAYHITAAITACIIMAIPLTRANRLAAMKELHLMIIHTLPARPPAFYVCPSLFIIFYSKLLLTLFTIIFKGVWGSML